LESRLQAVRCLSFLNLLIFDALPPKGEWH
jgi:hypothetical protein